MGVECYGFVCLCMPYSCLVHSLNRHRNEFREAHKMASFGWQNCQPNGPFTLGTYVAATQVSKIIFNKFSTFI